MKNFIVLLYGYILGANGSFIVDISSDNTMFNHQYTSEDCMDTNGQFYTGEALGIQKKSQNDLNAMYVDKDNIYSEIAYCHSRKDANIPSLNTKMLGKDAAGENNIKRLSLVGDASNFELEKGVIHAVRPLYTPILHQHNGADMIYTVESQGIVRTEISKNVSANNIHSKLNNNIWKGDYLIMCSNSIIKLMKEFDLYNYDINHIKEQLSRLKQSDLHDDFKNIESPGYYYPLNLSAKRGICKNACDNTYQVFSNQNINTLYKFYRGCGIENLQQNNTYTNRHSNRKNLIRKLQTLIKDMENAIMKISTKITMITEFVNVLHLYEYLISEITSKHYCICLYHQYKRAKCNNELMRKHLKEIRDFESKFHQDYNINCTIERILELYLDNLCIGLELYIKVNQTVINEWYERLEQILE